MQKQITLASFVFLVLFLICQISAASEKDRGVSDSVDLFNGVDLSGWECGKTPWKVENGILRNTGRGNDRDWIMYENQLPSGQFTLEIRLRVIDYTNNYPRPRIWLNNSHNFYFGNEGSTNQFQIYGTDLSNVKEVSDDWYSIGDWYVFCLVVNDQNQVSFFKNGILTHTATRVKRMPLQISIKAGDGWSAGHIEISSVKYTPKAILPNRTVKSQDHVFAYPAKHVIVYKEPAATLQEETEKELATLGIQANWPVDVRTMRKKARVYINRKANFTEIPEFLQGLQYTLHHRKRIINISCRVKTPGRIYLCLFGDKTPKSIGQHRDWKKCGTMRGPSFRGNNRWTIYQADVQAGEIVTLSRDDKMGLTVVAKEITKDKTRPLPKMPIITNAKKYTAGKSVEKRPIEYLVFGQGNDVVFILATIHGDEYVGTPLVHRLAEYLDKHPDLLDGRKVVLLPNANPDGMAHFDHFNINGVNLNRNFEASNRKNGGRNGPFSLSEPEAKVINDIIQKYPPNRVVSIHQMMGWTIESDKSSGMVDFEGPAEHLASVMSEHCGLPVERFGTQKGSLGAYVGDDLGIPIITLEIPKFDYGLNLEQLWEKYGTALIAAVTYPEEVKLNKMK